MEVNLFLGVAKVNITPPYPVPLAGFAHRTGVYEGIKQRLFARVFFFRSEAATGESQQAMIVSADLIWWGSKIARQLREELAEAFDLQRNSIILHATHTHSGPQTAYDLHPGLGIVCDEYVAFLQGQILLAAQMAFGDQELVTVSKGTGECNLGINRRKPQAGTIVMAPNTVGPVDKEVTVITFTSLTGKIKAGLIHYTCHPTSTADNFVSGDFPGFACEVLENYLGGRTVIAYLQGCTGDVRPNMVREESFYRGTAEDAAHNGEEIAQAVLSILAFKMKQFVPGELAFRQLQVPLRFELAAKQDGEKNEGRWTLELTKLILAQDLALIAMNGEMLVEYGLFIKEKSRQRCLPLGYSNGMVGYIPTGAQIRQGGYEVQESVQYFGLPGAFSPVIEAQIKKAIIALIEEDEESGITDSNNNC